MVLKQLEICYEIVEQPTPSTLEPHLVNIVITVNLKVKASDTFKT